MHLGEASCGILYLACPPLFINTICWIGKVKYWISYFYLLLHMMHPSYELCQIYPQNAHFECICISAKVHCICISTKIQCICMSTWKYLYFHPDTLCTVVLWYNAPSCDSISGLSPRQQHLQGASKKKHPPITSSYKYKYKKQLFAIFGASKKN